MALDVWEEFEWRGLNYQSTDPDLGKLLTSERLVVYCGFDPTSDSLTIGHLLQMVRLKWLQDAGHRPIAVAGGGTGAIGDPSGRESERTLLSSDEIEHNVDEIKKQLARFIDFDRGGLLVNNADWLAELHLTDFLRDVGKHFSVNAMIAKESVKARLTQREQGISFTEFSYMLLQAFDFLHLFEEYGCRMQIGGSDQWGNITAGIDLIRRKHQEPAYGLTCPLLEHEGRKMSKSEGTAVWLSPERTSPYRFYQFWVNTSDAQVGEFLRMYTFLERARIEELGEMVLSRPQAREAQKALALELTTLVHGQDEALRAREASSALFGSGVAALDERTFLEVMEEAPSSRRPRSALAGQGLPLVDLLVETELAPSRSAARTDVSGGGVYVNDSRRTGEDSAITRADLLHDRYVLLRRGKKTYHLLRFE